MIEVKGTRQPEAAPATNGERYSFIDPQVLSRVPIYIALLITGIAAYVKSASVASRPPATDEPERTPDGERALLLQPERESATLDNLEDYRGKSAVANSAPRPEISHSSHRRGATVIEFPKPNFILVDSAPLAFKDVSLAPGFEYPQFQIVSPTPQVPSSSNNSVHARLPQPGAEGEPTGNQGEPSGGEPNPPAKRNRPPELKGPVRLNDAMTGAVVLIGLSELLANASDADGDTLSVKNVRVSSGSIGSDAGGWIYSSNGQAPPAEVKITYEITDGLATVMQTATLDLERGAPIVGTEGAEPILGTALPDSIQALGGDDLIDAREGDDLILGGAGDDLIIAGAGDDVVFAGSGNDVVFGGAGNDLIAGGDGNDRLFGEAGGDTVLGDAGDDLVSGGDGDDFVSGGAGNDKVAGDAGDDTLSGGDGNDELADGAGSDRMFGDAGDDIVRVAADGADDVFDGGVGSDVLDFSATVLAFTVDLTTGEVTGLEVGNDTVSGFESIIGGAGDDALQGGEESVSLSGGKGDDVVSGGAGDDLLSGGDGDDRMVDGAGSDRIFGDAGNDVVVVAIHDDDDDFNGGVGNDVLDLSKATLDVTIDLTTGEVTSLEIGDDRVSGFETVIGGAGNDLFVVGGESMTLTGGAGDDTFSFTVPLAAAMERPQLIHDILDFLVGDRILVAEYEFATTRREGEEDRFQYYYRDREDGSDDLALRVRYDSEGEEEVTLLEVDRDGNHDFELTVAVHGHHELCIYEFSVA